MTDSQEKRLLLECGIDIDVERNIELVKPIMIEPGGFVNYRASIEMFVDWLDYIGCDDPGFHVARIMCK